MLSYARRPNLQRIDLSLTNEDAQELSELIHRYLNAKTALAPLTNFEIGIDEFFTHYVDSMLENPIMLRITDGIAKWEVEQGIREKIYAFRVLNFDTIETQNITELIDDLEMLREIRIEELEGSEYIDI